MNKKIIFELDTKEILNSNKVYSHYIIKSNMAAAIRKKAAEKGIKQHPNPEKAQQHYEEIKQQAQKTLEKSRAKKRLRKETKNAEEKFKKTHKQIEEKFKKDKTPLQEQEEYLKNIEQDLEDTKNLLERDYTDDIASIDEEFNNIKNTKVPFIYDKFKIVFTVCPPTKRRIDPPNLYPTLKALIDGLTDASWWPDDQYTNLLEVSFRYGGISGEKNTFKLILDIEELEETTEYITKPEKIL